MPKFLVQQPIRHDGVDFAVGETIELKKEIDIQNAIASRVVKTPDVIGEAKNEKKASGASGAA